MGARFARHGSVGRRTDGGARSDAGRTAGLASLALVSRRRRRIRKTLAMRTGADLVIGDALARYWRSGRAPSSSWASHKTGLRSAKQFFKAQDHLTLDGVCVQHFKIFAKRLSPVFVVEKNFTKDKVAYG